jgi:hypothetical protein
MSNHSVERRRSIFLVATVTLLLASLGMMFTVYTPNSSQVMAVTQEQYYSSTSNTWTGQYQGPGSSQNCGSNSCVYPSCGANSCSFQVCGPSGCTTAAGYTQMCGNANCAPSQCGPNGCYYIACHAVVQDTVQCSGYILQAQNGCVELQVPVANSQNGMMMTSASQFFTLHNLPLNTSSAVGTWVTVTGSVHQGANTAPNGAACPGNYINVTSMP